MKLGLIARADNTGLGVQTWEFYRHMHPHKTMVVDISEWNGNTSQHNDRYPKAWRFSKVQKSSHVTRGIPDRDVREFLHGLDLVFTCECPYNHLLYIAAKQKRVRVVNQFNYEFLDALRSTKVPAPDYYAAPTAWHYDDMQRKFGHRVFRLPVPVNRKVLTPVPKKEFRRFLHLAGIPATHDRNGTAQVIEAFRMIEIPEVSLTIRTQKKEAADAWRNNLPENVNVEYANAENYWDNYAGFDVLLLPRKFGGLCLPMQEALSCNIPVIMTDISPNEVLPQHWRVPAVKKGFFEASARIDFYECNPAQLADKVLEFAQMDEEQVQVEQARAEAIAAPLDWEVMAPVYRTKLESICATRPRNSF